MTFRKNRNAHRGLTAVMILTAALAAAPAAGLPVRGSQRPDVSLRDAWDRTLSLGRLRGLPVLVVYEDKDSAEHNAALKADLSRLAKGDKYKTSIALVAVADVSGYDYWPVRGFVKDAIRDESRKQGITIYCDWDGSARRRLDLRENASNVVLYDRDGKVLFSRAGTLAKAERDELIGLLRQQVERVAPR